MVLNNRRTIRCFAVRVSQLMMTCVVFSRVLVAQVEDDPVEFFEKRVRPILAESCFDCHGPQKQKAELRLDSLEAMLRGGEGGSVVVPGDPAQSRLIRAISYDDPELQMPPRSKLEPEKIADLTRWVEMGAPWPDHEAPAAATGGSPSVFDLNKRKSEHWAWQPITNPAPPPVKDSAWPLNEVDQFILAKLETEGMKPAPSASREKLIRRATFDLTGLPPTPDEIAAFVSDESPDAWKKVIDRLLASRAYGERWGRHWLDLVRYAESFGHEQDFPIAEAWRYRDYVVRAMNADVPYDQFLTEHIAGDLIPNPRRNPMLNFNESVIGTGFWYMGQATHAPVDLMQDEAERLDNQVDVFSKAFLGMTVSCARCHDHKFDAISAKDYHALWGYLKSSRRQFYELDPEGRIEKTANELRQLRVERDRLEAERFKAIPPESWDSIALYMQAARDVSLKHAPSLMSAVIALDLELPVLEEWVRLFELPETDVPEHPLNAWKALAGQCDSDDPWIWELRARQWLEDSSKAEYAKRSVVFEDFDSLEDWDVSGEAFQLTPSGVAHSGREGKSLRGILRSKTFTIEKPEIHYLMSSENATIRLVIAGYTMRDYHDLLFGDMRLEVSTVGKHQWVKQVKDVGRYIGHRAYIEIEDTGDGFAAVDEIRFADSEASVPNENAITDALRTRFASGAPASPGDLARAFEVIAREADSNNAFVQWLVSSKLISLGEPSEALAQVQARIEELNKSIPKANLALAMRDGTPENAHVFIRGSAKTPGDMVPRRFLEAISEVDLIEPEKGSGRMELARNMIDPANPLTARVMVNRVWMHLFGRGIVATPDNFGALGEKPSYPELLDYLATRFRSEGWSVKSLIRNLMMSRAYQMQSEVFDAESEQKDPANIYLHRMRLRRLEAEAIRDTLLHVADSLNRDIGGEPVNVNLTPFMDGRNPPKSGPLDGAGRRSIYIGVRRNFLSPMLLAFDFPIPDSTVGRRNNSNLPAQALILMNDPFVRGQAERLAASLCEKVNDPRARIETMYLKALGRTPDEAEVYRALVFLNTQTREWGNVDPESDAVQNAWADLGQVIFMMKEFIFIS